MKITRFATQIKKALVQKRVKSELPIDPDKLDMFKAAERALRNVKVPGYEVNVIDSGVVKLLRLTDDGKLVVFLDYFGSDPVCYFCRFLNNYLWSKIVSEAREELKKEGFTNIIFVDYYTGFLLEDS